MTDLDFPCREGQTVSVIWAIPDGAIEGPYVSALNHNTKDKVVVAPNRIAYAWAKPQWMLLGGAAAALIVVGAVVNWFVGIVAALAPPFYFTWRSRNAAKSLIASPELGTLDRQLAAVAPLPG
jgi:hypothetical protein